MFLLCYRPVWENYGIWDAFFFLSLPKIFLNVKKMITKLIWYILCELHLSQSIRGCCFSSHSSGEDLYVAVSCECVLSTSRNFMAFCVCVHEMSNGEEEM